MYLSVINVHFVDVQKILSTNEPKYADLADNLSDFTVIEVCRALLAPKPLLDLGNLGSKEALWQLVCFDCNPIRHEISELLSLFH